METTIVYWGFIGIMEKKMEATIVYWGFIGTLKNALERFQLDFSTAHTQATTRPVVLESLFLFIGLRAVEGLEYADFMNGRRLGLLRSSAWMLSSVLNPSPKP